LRNCEGGTGKLPIPYGEEGEEENSELYSVERIKLYIYLCN
jgi:hypothetical protein